MTTTDHSRWDTESTPAALRSVEGLLGTCAPVQFDERRLHPDVVEALTAAGLFGLRVPTRFGGLEADARTLRREITALARLDGSAAWNVAACAMSSWLAGQFPDAVQEQIFAEPDAVTCSVLSPTGTLTSGDTGWVLNGRWAFVSGVWHSRWQIALAMAPTPDLAGQWPVLVAVPVSELDVIDDWRTSGLRGTGSVTTIADGVIVPPERVVPLPLVLQGVCLSVRNAAAPVWRVPMIPTGCVTFAGVAVGLAEAACEAFLDKASDRKITYTDYEVQAAAPITHLQVAEAVLKTDEARSHADRLVEMVEARADVADWSLQDRTLARARLGRAFQLAYEAVECLRTGSGASSLCETSPINRIAADIAALRQHALMHPNTNTELHGRVLCGQAPNTQYL